MNYFRIITTFFRLIISSIIIECSVYSKIFVHIIISVQKSSHILHINAVVRRLLLCTYIVKIIFFVKQKISGTYIIKQGCKV